MAGWAAAICGALSLPVFGLSFASGKGNEAVMMTAATMLGILVLAGLVIGIPAVFSKRPRLAAARDFVAGACAGLCSGNAADGCLDAALPCRGEALAG